jgi:SAM-dependent methyltransferase
VVAALVMAVENRKTNELLVDIASLRDGDSALDVGCGPGMAVRHAARVRGVTVTGVDASATSIAVARALTASRAGLRFEVASSDALPFATGDFTVAWSMNSVHHWPDREGGLREVHRVLEPGGRLVVGERRPSPDAGRWSPPGMSDEAVHLLVGQIKAAGFTDITTAEQAVGKDRFVAITASPS